MPKEYHDDEHLLSATHTNSSTDSLVLPQLEPKRPTRRRAALLVSLSAVLAGILLASFAVFRPKSQPVKPNEPAQHPNDHRVGSNIGDFKYQSLSSLLDPKPHPKARDIRIHFINHHFGTSSEIQAISHAISERNNVKIEVTETQGIFAEVKGLHTSKEASNKYWPIVKERECNTDKYDMIIVGDTLPLIRPHLQNCCSLRLLSILTTRFDWAQEEDVEWTYLIANASRWNNFRIYPNNFIEKWFADWKQADVLMHDYLPSSGIPSPLWSEAVEPFRSKLTQPNDHELILPLGLHAVECLVKSLQGRNIAFTTYPRSQYGGPLALTDRVVIRFPYQSNTMSLFENLHERVIYVLPTLRLYREMGATCGAGLEKIPNEQLTDEDFYTKADWWRRDLQHLFFYFDNFDELKEGSELRKRIVRESDLKRVYIAEYVLRQREYVMQKWQDILFDKWENEGQADDCCFAYRDQNKNITAS